MKIYTKTGDKGTTALFGGKRVKKYNLRIESYGTVDELNSHIGLVRDQDIERHYKDVLAKIQNKLFRYEEAIVTQRKSQSLDPLFLTSTYNLGLLLTWQGKYSEAEQLFNQLRIDFPKSPFSYRGAHDLYYSQGNFVGAIQEAKKAAELSPDNIEFERKLFDSLSMLGLTNICQLLSEGRMCWVKQCIVNGLCN